MYSGKLNSWVFFIYPCRQFVESIEHIQFSLPRQAPHNLGVFGKLIFSRPKPDGTALWWK